MNKDKSNIIKKIGVKGIFGVGIGITLLIFLVNFYLVGFGVYGDGIGYYTPLRSLVFDGNLRIADEYEFLSHSASKFGGGIRVTALIPEYSKFTIGTELILSPFFMLGHLVTLILQRFGVNIEANGYSWTYELFYCLGSIGLGITGLILCYRAASRYFSQFSSLLAVVGIWFASSLTFYLCREVSMSHAVSQFVISLFLYLCITTAWEKRRSQQILLGVVLGLGTLVRPQDILFGIVPILMGLSGIESKQVIEKDFFPNSKTLVSQSKRHHSLKFNIFSFSRLQRAIKTVKFRNLLNKNYLITNGIIILFCSLMQIPQILVYQWQFGSLLKIPYLQEGATVGHSSSFSWGNPQIFNTLFSGFHGLFTWHPLLFLSMVGLMISTQKIPRLALILFTAFCLQVYFVAAWWCWWQGASFGGRMFCNSTFIFVFGLAALWDNFQQRHWTIFAFLTTGFFMIWNTLLAIQYQFGMIPPEANISIWQLFKNQVFAIPFFLRHIFNR